MRLASEGVHGKRTGGIGEASLNRHNVQNVY